MKKYIMTVVISTLCACGGGGGGADTSSSKVTVKVSASGLTEDICGVELRVAYPSSTSFSVVTATGNYKNLLQDPPRVSSNSIFINMPTGTPFNGSGDVVDVVFTPSTNTGFRVYSSNVVNCVNYDLQPKTFNYTLQ